MHALFNVGDDQGVRGVKLVICSRDPRFRQVTPRSFKLSPSHAVQ